METGQFLTKVTSFPNTLKQFMLENFSLNINGWNARLINFFAKQNDLGIRIYTAILQQMSSYHLCKSDAFYAFS